MSNAFSIDINKTRIEVQEFKDIQRKVKAQADQLQSVKNNLSIKGTAHAGIKRNLGRINEEKILIQGSI